MAGREPSACAARHLWAMVMACLHRPCLAACPSAGALVKQKQTLQQGSRECARVGGSWELHAATAHCKLLHAACSTVESREPMQGALTTSAPLSDSPANSNLPRAQHVLCAASPSPPRPPAKLPARAHVLKALVAVAQGVELNPWPPGLIRAPHQSHPAPSAGRRQRAAPPAAIRAWASSTR